MEINNSKTLPLLESLDNYSYHTINCEKNKGDKEEITLRALFSVMRQFPPTPLSLRPTYGMIRIVVNRYKIRNHF